MSLKKTVAIVLVKKEWLDIEMKKLTRDLILLRKDVEVDELYLKREVQRLDTILQPVETTAALCASYELVDLNRFKVVHQHAAIAKVLRPGGLKPFQFLVNRN